VPLGFKVGPEEFHYAELIINDQDTRFDHELPPIQVIFMALNPYHHPGKANRYPFMSFSGF
ncbi:MAG: hypothetical protein V3R96_08240, partial [Dehalococcoidales bacterium]